MPVRGVSNFDGIDEVLYGCGMGWKVFRSRDMYVLYCGVGIEEKVVSRKIDVQKGTHFLKLAVDSVVVGDQCQFNVYF
jgi:hypothetical protein